MGIREGDTIGRIPAIKAVYRKLINEALKGNVRAIGILTKMLPDEVFDDEVKLVVAPDLGPPAIKEKVARADAVRKAKLSLNDNGPREPESG